MKPCIVLGSGGHAKVVCSLLRRLNCQVLGLVGPGAKEGDFVYGYPFLGDDKKVFDFSTSAIELVNGVGSLPADAGLRMSLFTLFSDQGYCFKTLIDPLALVNDDVVLEQGVQVMLGAMIQVGCRVAVNSIINTGAIVDHDCNIGRHVHIAPGVVLSGSIKVADNVHIGTGARIIQGVCVGANSIVGAGSVLTKNVAQKMTVYPPQIQIKESRNKV